MNYSPVVFLLGAGASNALNVPDFSKCWKCLDKELDIEGDGHIPAKYSSPLTNPIEVARRCHRQLADEGYPKDLERLCEALRQESKRKMARDNFNQRHDKQALLDARSYIDAEYLIRTKFIDLVSVDVSRRIHERAPPAKGKGNCIASLWALIASDRTTWSELYKEAFFFSGKQVLADIFTCNNDLAVETLAASWDLPLADGFDEHGALETSGWPSLRQAASGIRLYKLHGSIDWRRQGSRIVKQSEKSVLAMLRRRSIASEAWNVPLIWPGVYGEHEQIAAWREEFLVEAVTNAKCFIVAGH